MPEASPSEFFEIEVEKAQQLLAKRGLPQPSKPPGSALEPTTNLITSALRPIATNLASSKLYDVSVSELLQIISISSVSTVARDTISNEVYRGLRDKIHFTSHNQVSNVLNRAYLATIIEIGQNKMKTRGIFPHIAPQLSFWLLKSLLWHQQEQSAYHYVNSKLDAVDQSRDKYVEGLRALIPYMQEDDDSLAKQLIIMSDVLRTAPNVMFEALKTDTLTGRPLIMSTRNRLSLIALEHPEDLLPKLEKPFVEQPSLF